MIESNDKAEIEELEKSLSEMLRKELMKPQNTFAK